MRTTVTLDPDTEALVRRRMRERRISFKQAVNDAIRSGLATDQPPPYRMRTWSLGTPLVDLDHALQLAGELEDEEIISQLRRSP